MNDPNVSNPTVAADISARAKVELQEPLEAQLEPLGRRALSALSPRPGERILDIGCGTGATSIELAHRVGRHGEVLAIDISPIVLEAAARNSAGCAQLRFVEGDAGTYPFALQSFDAAFSRFGVMFFADPVAAFRNIRRALKPGGRLAFVCWRALRENDLDHVPLQAASPYLPPQLPDPAAAPPFAFADARKVRDVLAGAGFEEIDIVPHDVPVGTGDLDTMLALSLRVGSLGAIVREHPLLGPVLAGPVRKALAVHDGPDGVRLNAATWIVSARAKQA